MMFLPSFLLFPTLALGAVFSPVLEHKASDLDSRIHRLNIAARHMGKIAGQTLLHPESSAPFSFSRTHDKEQPLHSWYALVDVDSSSQTIGAPGAADAPVELPEGYRQLLAEKRLTEEKVKSNQHYFQQIREAGAGSRLADVLGRRTLAEVPSDVELWKLLLQSIRLGDADFEHQFGMILGSEHERPEEAARAALQKYTFPEIMLLTRSVLFIPALQHVEAMSPGMWADVAEDVVGGARPILNVGLVAGCVKGPVYKYLAESHPQLAYELADTNHVGRQMAQIVRAILFSGLNNWVLFSTLPGSGAFADRPAARATDIGPKFFSGLAQGLLADGAHAQAKRVSLYGAPGWFGTPAEISELNEKIGSEMVTQNPRGVGIGASIADDEIPVVIAGFDPVALAPHGAQYRAVSGEGQLAAGTTMLETLGAYVPGSLVKTLVEMEKNVAKPGEQPRFETARAVRMLPKEVATRGDLSLVPSNGGRQLPNNDCQQGWDLQTV